MMINGFIIEPVSEGDFDALRTLFVSALEAHYDGDHAAHLARLFDAYRINGRDANGYNSLAQLGYIARRETGGPPVGFVNFVVKRHGTVKISPLIVDTSVLSLIHI